MSTIEQAPPMPVPDDNQVIEQQAFEQPDLHEQLPGESFWERHAETPMTYMGITAPPSVLIKLCPKDAAEMTLEDKSRFTAKIASKDPNFEMEETDKQWLESVEAKRAAAKEAQKVAKISEKGNEDTTKQEQVADHRKSSQDSKELAMDKPIVVVDANTRQRVEAMSRSLIEHVQRTQIETTPDLALHNNEPVLHKKTEQGMFTPKPINESVRESVLSVLPPVAVAHEKIENQPIISKEVERKEGVEEIYVDLEQSDQATALTYEDIEVSRSIESQPKIAVKTIEYDSEQKAIELDTVQIVYEAADSVPIEESEIMTNESVMPTNDFEDEPPHDEAEEISKKLSAWTLEDILELTKSLHENNEAPELVYESRMDKTEAAATVPVSPTETIVHTIEASLVLQPEQVEKTEVFVATIPEEIQQKLLEFFAIDDDAEQTPEEIENAEQVKQLTVRIAEVADRLHILFTEDRLDSKEAEMIEEVLVSQYTELLEIIGVEIEEDTVRNFINLIRSETYSYQSVQAVKMDWQLKWEKDHWATIVSDQDDDESLLHRWINAGKAVVKKNVTLKI